jgi:hypothetical protein
LSKAGDEAVTTQDDVPHKKQSATAWWTTIQSGHLSPPTIRCSEARALDFDRPSGYFNEQTSLAVEANRWFGSPLAGSSRMDRN